MEAPREELLDGHVPARVADQLRRGEGIPGEADVRALGDGADPDPRLVETPHGVLLQTQGRGAQPVDEEGLVELGVGGGEAHPAGPLQGPADQADGQVDLPPRHPVDERVVGGRLPVEAHRHAEVRGDVPGERYVEPVELPVRAAQEEGRHVVPVQRHAQLTAPQDPGHVGRQGLGLGARRHSEGQERREEEQGPGGETGPHGGASPAAPRWRARRAARVPSPSSTPRLASTAPRSRSARQGRATTSGTRVPGRSR